jgi:uncharacterized protein
VSISPELHGQAAEHWRGAASGELRLPHCLDCGKLWFPPTRQCPRCLSEKIDWLTASGRGRITGWCIMHQRYFDQFDLPLPYAVLLVQLDEGPLLYSNYDEPTTVPAVGQRVQAEFVSVAPDAGIVRFRLISEPS